MKIENNNVVSIEYTLTNTAGDVMDSSANHGKPLKYLHGASNIIPGLENALTGKEVGDKLSVTVEPSEAYGDKNDVLVETIPMDYFDGIENLSEGMQLKAQGDDGQEHLVTVTKIEDGQVTVDGNHPLAGQVLSFDVEVVEVREAAQEELDHGHAH